MREENVESYFKRGQMGALHGSVCVCPFEGGSVGMATDPAEVLVFFLMGNRCVRRVIRRASWLGMGGSEETARDRTCALPSPPLHLAGGATTAPLAVLEVN
ncbi:hypothetical protein Taro_044585 [Colocasia esculenta]|uniref:Uncharacterized protein n=1 Tax=Colocasia esculenta TaxID=4460 RepID=A0A843X2Z7_COLES|nr:hypothetical protein [Colocasia esculenta]